MRLVFLALCCVIFVAACSPNDEIADDTRPTATPTQATPGAGAFISPPSAYLKDSSGRPVEGVTGTYCWQQGQGGLCADYSPWLSNKSAIPLRAGQPLEFVFDAGQPREARVRWLEVSMATPRDVGDGFDWTPLNPSPGPLSADLRAPASAGRYALAVMALFPQGDVTYGFYVEVN